jgi:peptidyl-dipeptidase Dcp
LSSSFLLVAVLVTLAGCGSQGGNQAALEDNPFLQPYDTEYNVQPFDRIEAEHFVPAFEEAMRLQEAEHQAIIDNPDPPTFENTIAELDRSGELLTEVSRVFYSRSGADTNEEIQAINREMSPRLAAHRDELRLNKQMFERVKAVYDAREDLDLTAEQLFLLENMYKRYVRNGALLSDEEKTRLKEINQKLSKLGVTFRDNLLAETNAFQLVVEDESRLSGLPQSSIDAAANTAEAAGKKGAWIFTPHKPSMLPFLTYADDRELRQELYTAYITRGHQGNEHDNTGILAEIVELRAEKAKLLGYDTYADYVLEVRMAQTPGRVYELLNRLWDASLPVAKNEVEQMQAIIDREGGGFKLASWDWWYYAEKLRQEKYALDDNELRPYFELGHVRDGVFWVANQLYGLTFEPLDDLPKPHEESQVFLVKEADGSHCAVIYMDFHPRPGKRPGAWCGGFRRQNRARGEEVDPIVDLVCNFTRPSGDKPALLSLEEVTTLFHEFGHALDGMLSDKTYRTTFGSPDFGELPSQIMEHWAVEPEVLTHYAKHYQTGEPIPDALIQKISNSKYFNQGFDTVEYLAASLLDMKYHTLEDAASLDAVAFENALFEEIGLIPEIISRYRSGYFAHIIGGYAAGYYGYIWCNVLDSDAFQAFKETSLFDQATAQRFRETILARNGTADFRDMYLDFRGRDPDIEPLLRDRGFQ